MTAFLFEAGKWAATASLSAILSAMGPRFDYGGKPFDAAEWTAWSSRDGTVPFRVAPPCGGD